MTSINKSLEDRGSVAHGAVRHTGSFRNVRFLVVQAIIVYLSR